MQRIKEARPLQTGLRRVGEDAIRLGHDFQYAVF